MSAPEVLVVEDEGLIALLLDDMLEDLGFHVAYSAASVAQALAWLDQGGAPDAALLDVNLAGEKVFPVADALAARGVPFVFSSGYGEMSERRFGAAPMLGKPIRADRLAEVLRGLGLG
jgi:CheY-like chemotaxis protein